MVSAMKGNVMIILIFPLNMFTICYIFMLILSFRHCVFGVLS